MIGFLVQGKVRIMIKFRVRVRVGVTFNVSIYRRSNCRRSKCRTFQFQSMFSDLELCCIMLCKSKGKRFYAGLCVFVYTSHQTLIFYHQFEYSSLIL